MVSSSDSYQKIRKNVDEIRLIDSHEHLFQEQDRIQREVDVFSIFRPYCSSDLVSCGMPAEEVQAIQNPALPLEERWAMFEPYWDNIKHTGYARALEIAASDLYGVEDISGRTYIQLSKRMKDANRRGLHKWILQEKAGIDRCILDPVDNLGRAARTIDVDRTLFDIAMEFDDFVLVNNIFSLRDLSKRIGVAIHSLPDLLKALEVQFEQVAHSIVAVKIALAYFRTVEFEKTTQSDAEKVFNTIFRKQPLDWNPDSLIGSVLLYGPSLDEAKPLQDFMVHRVIQLAARHKLPVQIHTGLQEGIGNIISNSNPLNLTNLFVEYSDVKFDIFHGGFPYTGEVAVLAKNFQNVYLDMCWLHIISPSRARSALREWLETVPVNKIVGFGGDYLFAEGTYGHSVLARQNVSRVLSEMVDDGSLSFSDAESLAKKLLRENALRLFRIGT